MIDPLRVRTLPPGTKVKYLPRMLPDARSHITTVIPYNESVRVEQQQELVCKLQALGFDKEANHITWVYDQLRDVVQEANTKIVAAEERAARDIKMARRYWIIGCSIVGFAYTLIFVRIMAGA